MKLDSMTKSHRKGMGILRNERLVTLRDSRNLTQEELGERVDLTQSMIARIESGKRDPRKEHKIKLAKFFGVTVEWLFYEQINDQKSLKESHTA